MLVLIISIFGIVVYFPGIVVSKFVFGMLVLIISTLGIVVYFFGLVVS